MNELENLEKLRRLYRANAAAKALLDYFSERQRNATETPLSRLETVLSERSTPVPRWDLISLAKEIAELGYGEFVVGRRGRESRIVWKVGINSLAHAAQGQQNNIDPLNEDDPPNSAAVPLGTSTPVAPRPAIMCLSFPLRQDSGGGVLNAQLTLPKDFNRRDAERLIGFIKTLPFDRESAAANGNG
jgi:hypothetical protein